MLMRADSLPNLLSATAISLLHWCNIVNYSATCTPFRSTLDACRNCCSEPAESERVVVLSPGTHRAATRVDADLRWCLPSAQPKQSIVIRLQVVSSRRAAGRQSP